MEAKEDKISVALLRIFIELIPNEGDIRDGVKGELCKDNIGLWKRFEKGLFIPGFFFKNESFSFDIGLRELISPSFEALSLFSELKSGFNGFAEPNTLKELIVEEGL